MGALVDQTQMQTVLRYNPFRVGSHLALADLAATEGDREAARAEVLVIGAGASGLCSAKYLLESGFDVTVFEIGTQIGGPPPFGKADRSRFLSALDEALVRLRRMR